MNHALRMHEGTVISNHLLCREHLRLTVRMPSSGLHARPGQFVHLCPPHADAGDYRTFDWTSERPHPQWSEEIAAPMLRRAFSIAGLRQSADTCEMDVIYRVVGKATAWMESLKADDAISVLGPVGNAFPVRTDKQHAWMVAGGVGLPPMLWLAEALQAAGRQAVAFCGARSSELLPLSITAPVPADACSAAMAAGEFSRSQTPVVIATDDGSLGFAGHVGAAMAAYHAAHPVPPDDLVVYTCGPERMMQFVGDYCVARGIECYVCMERSMACGMGTCQSCVVPVTTGAGEGSWRYALCCTEGPVFSAAEVLWHDPRATAQRVPTA